MMDLASQIIPLIDLTLLREDAHEKLVRQLCQDACSSLGKVAAVCVLPAFIQLAQRILKGTMINIATVCNFPYGTQRLEKTLAEIDVAILLGANEIDLVMPYQQYLAGERGEVIHYVESCRQACPDPVILKIILETGAFDAYDVVYAAAKDMIYAGADFIKTSTGKLSMGADLNSAHAILKAIKITYSFQQEVGLKISGGIRTVEQVKAYFELVKAVMGSHWINPHTFRIGTSQLLEHLHASC